MAMEDRVLEAIYAAIDELNEMLAEEAKLRKSPETPLVDGPRQLDSLGMVNLVVTLESSLENTFGLALNLADALESDEMMDIFRSVGSLRDHIVGRLDRHGPD